jgi:hypothetical protein
MKYIEVKDNKWHDITQELPAISSNVEFLNNAGEIIPNGHIVIEMSGAFAALDVGIGFLWDSMDRYKYWKFR